MESTIVPLVLRLALAAVIFPHGAQKVLGWFGGSGAEFLGPLGLAVGLFTRVAALGIASVMIVAIVLVHRSNGFFMNWYGSQAGEGFECHLLALGLAVALIVGGAGAWSLDALVASWGHA